LGTPSPTACGGRLPSKRCGGGVEIGGVLDDIAECGEGLGLEFLVDGLAAGGVDAFDVGNGAPVLVALGECVELGEGDGVYFADEDWRHGGVEEVLE